MMVVLLVMVIVVLLVMVEPFVMSTNIIGDGDCDGSDKCGISDASDGDNDSGTCD
jgi:hypothetical protein